MIVTCASCLTKFNLDDSRIPAKGTKVRCSRCKHVFYVAPPPETKEEIFEGFESFAKYHEELLEPGQKELEFPPSLEEEEKGMPIEEEEKEKEKERRRRRKKKRSSFLKRRPQQKRNGCLLKKLQERRRRRSESSSRRGWCEGRDGDPLVSFPFSSFWSS